MSDSNLNQDKTPIFHMVLFCSFLAAFGGLLIFLPKEELDLEENRKLSTFPRWTTTSLLSGAYMDSLDNYSADHFPLRKVFLSLSFQMKNIRGIPNREMTFHSGVQAIDEESETKEQTSLVKDEETKNSKGLLVLNGQGYQIFNPEKKQIAAFSSLINSYYSTFNGAVPIYYLIVPSPVDFLLSSQYSEYVGVDHSTILQLNKKVNPMVRHVSLYEEFRRHKNEYLFYRTDHHWTSLGAYYAYVAFCKKKGVVPVDLKEMRHQRLPGTFLGTHYLKTKDRRLQASPDTVHYWIPFIEPKGIRLGNSANNKIDVFKTFDIAINKYLVFLGGDQPTMVLHSSRVKNGKTLLLIKNSYGNPLAPYFANNYETVVVMDYRYTKEKVRNVVDRYKVDDLLIINSIFSANAPTHLEKLMKILK